MHDAEEKQKQANPPIVVSEPEGEQEPVSRAQGNCGQLTDLLQTIKGQAETRWQDSQGSASGRLSVGRGDLDQALRSMREGKRRARPQRPLSKIFIDGSSSGGRRQSRAYE